MLHRESNCSLARTMDNCIMRCGIISSCQSAATSEIVKRSRSCVQRCGKYRTFTFTITFQPAQSATPGPYHFKSRSLRQYEPPVKVGARDKDFCTYCVEYKQVVIMISRHRLVNSNRAGQSSSCKLAKYWDGVSLFWSYESVWDTWTDGQTDRRTGKTSNSAYRTAA